MKSTRILSVVACMSLTDIVGAQVRLEWKRNVGKGDRKMRALVRRDDSLRFPLYEVPRDTLGWSQGSIGTPAQDMELVVSMDYSDVVVPELDSQLCKAEKSNCSFAGAFAPGKSSTYEEVGEEYNQLTAESPINQTGKYFKDTLRIGDVELNGLRMALLDELHFHPLKDVSWSFIDWTPSLGIGPNSSVLNAMIKKGLIKSSGYSIWQDETHRSSDCFKPAGADKCSPKSEYGTILLGAVDKGKYEGNLISIDMTSEQVGLDKPWIWESRIVLAGVAVSNGADPSSPRKISQDLPVTVKHSLLPISILPESIVSQIWDTFGVVVLSERDGLRSSQGRVPCDPAKRNKTSTGSINLRFGGRCGPEVEIPFEDLVSAADDPDFYGAEMSSNDEGEVIPWCSFHIQKLGTFMDPNGNALSAEIGAAVWKNMYMVFDFENGKVAMAKSKKTGGRDEVVVFKGKDAKIPGAWKFDVDDSTVECKSLVAPEEESTNSNSKDSGSNSNSDSNANPLHRMKWGLALPYFAMGLRFLF